MQPLWVSFHYCMWFCFPSTPPKCIAYNASILCPLYCFDSFNTFNIHSITALKCIWSSFNTSTYSSKSQAFQNFFGIENQLNIFKKLWAKMRLNVLLTPYKIKLIIPSTAPYKIKLIISNGFSIGGVWLNGGCPSQVYARNLLQGMHIYEAFKP